MKILFISYWGVNEGLSQATVLPHLAILNSFSQVDAIYFCSLERNNLSIKTPLPEKVIHIPYITGNSFWNKLSDFIFIAARLKKVIMENDINFMICRGAPAGSLGYLVHKKTGIPYAVESFEPHAAYMIESGVWNALGLKYLFQYYWEQKQKRTAYRLLPVSNQFKEHLCREGIPEDRILTMPCAVNLSMFAFDESVRHDIRKELGISQDAVVGIYAGKFGGLYENETSFSLFSTARSNFGNYFQLIITPDSNKDIYSKMLKNGFKENEFFIRSVKHSDIPKYLSASDFAFATYKELRSNKYLSPIKIGEYWANGLPVMLTEGVGDDSKLILRNKEAGSLFNFKSEHSIADAYKNIARQLKNGSRSDRFHRLAEIAQQHRSFDTVRHSYELMLTDLLAENRQ